MAKSCHVDMNSCPGVWPRNLKVQFTSSHGAMESRYQQTAKAVANISQHVRKGSSLSVSESQRDCI